MNHRVGSAFTLVSALLFPFIANAQVANQGWWQGPARPQTPQARAYAQPTYAPTYTRPGYAARPYPSAPAPTPAAYNYAGYPAYANPYPGYPNQYPASPNQYPAYANQYPAYGGQPSANGSASANRAAAGSLGAEASGPLVSTTDNLHYVQMGMGAFVPTDQGNPAKLGLEASLWAIHGGWVPNSGLYLTLDASTGFDIGCMAKRATDGCKGHLRIHWLGAGPFINTGTPMIASDVPRSWDLMALTGAEVRLWKGMTMKTTVNWFLPSPWGVYAHEKELADAKMNGTATASPNTASPGAATAEAAGQLNPMDAVESTLGHALKHPQLNLMAMWEF